MPGPDPQAPRGIEIRNRLEVLGTNQLLIPGCEPTSAVTSVTLGRQSKCCNSLVDVNAALKAVPGSTLLFMINSSGESQFRKRWFVLPAVNPDCPCPSPAQLDVYQILRDLACEEEPEVEELECEVIDQGFCPSPDFETIPPPRPDPYFEEGTFPPGVTVGTLRQPRISC